MNWPPQRDSKADVSSASPSSERIEELRVVCFIYRYVELRYGSLWPLLISRKHRKPQNSRKKN